MPIRTGAKSASRAAQGKSLAGGVDGVFLVGRDDFQFLSFDVREHDLGDPLVGLSGVPVGQGLARPG